MPLHQMMPTISMHLSRTEGSGVEGMYRSTDKGANWSSLTLPNDVQYGTEFSRGQAWYDLTLAVDPNDKEAVFTGAINLFKTTNGGTSWTQISHWYGGFGYPGFMQISMRLSSDPVLPTRLFLEMMAAFIIQQRRLPTPSYTNQTTITTSPSFIPVRCIPVTAWIILLQDNGTQQFNGAGIDATDGQAVVTVDSALLTKPIRPIRSQHIQITIIIVLPMVEQRSRQSRTTTPEVLSTRQIMMTT
ncbi:MAG: hypothetical protein R3C26_09500 [Calditrichia bacterium]